jgi:PadR family transcriptional regulator, regulatory protein PadR
MSNQSAVTSRGALLLALLRGPGYGLELLKRVETLTDGHVRLLQASVYPTLRALEDEGLLTSFEGEPVAERGGKPRRYYKLTAIGQRDAASIRRAVYALVHNEAGDVGGAPAYA